ncbi:MAG: DUF4249 family protein [Bacteroidia bacterium]|nr:DUF4249 family protein [Bacteroidia bacterium]
MKKKNILYFVLFIIILYSCRTDFNINAEWEDITVVYGLLDQDDTAHYIKINKTFLGDEDAYIMAQESDSLYYDSLYVTLEEWKNNSLSNTFILSKTVNEISKDPGIFSNERNILYKTTASLDALAEYKLLIYIPHFDKEVTASTELISGLIIKGTWQDEHKEVNLVSEQEIIELVSAKNAKIYDLTLRFHYYETYNELTFTEDSIDYFCSSILSGTALGSEKLELILNGQLFLQYLASRLKNDPLIRRVARSTKYYTGLPPNDMGPVDIIISMGGEDLFTYIEVNMPSNGIIQEKPAYSNISNGGIGIFSCRHSKIIRDKEFTGRSLDSLALSKSTRFLNFRDQNGNYWWE